MRITIILAISLFSFALLGPYNIALAYDSSTAPVGGQADPASAEVNFEDLGTLDEGGAVDIGESLIHPASPLYFLKTIRERIETALGGSNEVRAMREMEFAQRRLREIKTLIRNRRQDLVDSTLEKYKQSLDRAKNLSADDKDLAVRVGEAVARHFDVLQRTHDQVGDPRAKQAIRAALERAEEHNRLLLAKLTLIQQQQLIRKTALRQAHACKFLIREATAAGLTETEREMLKQRVGECRQNIRENLRDELDEIRQRRKQLRQEGQRIREEMRQKSPEPMKDRRGATPSSVTP